MSWQGVITLLIVVLCFAEIIRRIIRFFHPTQEEKENPCLTCSTGCDLKELLEKKRNACKEEEKANKEKKKCSS
ncbi:hypothetical protein D0T50_00585 [Bacteroides sp. 214]|uniref:hypothetical protein n=1 Tax=Bacteroides sp. 214 TaxID=2302935 RepID=UPI0013D6449E|nr:hypothetical protein [Bacteroides sp. 214]NDW11385.1 hypothetical protein [Bacteroides sp. 214]